MVYETVPGQFGGWPNIGTGLQGGTAPCGVADIQGAFAIPPISAAWLR